MKTAAEVPSKRDRSAAPTHEAIQRGTNAQTFKPLGTLAQAPIPYQKFGFARLRLGRRWVAALDSVNEQFDPMGVM